MAEHGSHGRAGGLASTVGRIALSTFAVLALRWHVPLVAASVERDGAVDATVAVFLASFFLGVVGLPGFLAGLWQVGARNCWWIRAGLLATIVSSVTTAGWIGVSVRAIGATLRAAEIVAYLLPLGVTAATAIVLRFRVARVTSH